MEQNCYIYKSPSSEQRDVDLCHQPAKIDVETLHDGGCSHLGDQSQETNYLTAIITTAAELNSPALTTIHDAPNSKPLGI